MPIIIRRLTSWVSLVAGIVLIAAALMGIFFSEQSLADAQTGLIAIGSVNQSVNVLTDDPLNEGGDVENGDPSQADLLFENTPQLATIREQIILGPFDLNNPQGLCTFDIARLGDIEGINFDVLTETQIPNELVLWRLRPNAAANPDEAWVEEPYVYDGRADSMLFQCLDSATYVLYQGTPASNLNVGLSDAGQLPQQSVQWLLVIAGLLLSTGGAIGVSSSNAKQRS